MSGWILSAIPAEERAALISFYNATNGDNWWHNSGWKAEPLEADGFGPSGSEGTWYGITVPGDHVTEISIPWFNNISGTIPPEIGNLVYLERLDVEGDPGTWSAPLYGNIPAELGNLANLEYFEVNQNSLTGSLPPELGKLKNLKYLRLEFNQLGGTIPSQLGNLKNLNTLDLYHNSLTGNIPPELGGMSNLDSLYLNSNLLTGGIPPELGNLGKLTSLYLDGNMISGIIPPELGNMSHLGAFGLSDNYLSGSIPRELAQLTNLYHLGLDSNQLVGEIPSSFINLTNLSYFNVNYNGLFTYDESLRTFLNGVKPGWESTQTVAPTGLSASTVDTSSIKLSWTPIRFTDAAGGYKVYYSTSPGGPWTYAGMIPGKLMSSYTVSGLKPGVKYYFIVKSQSDPHRFNDNTVVSASSEEVYARTLKIIPGEDQPPFGLMELPIGNGEPRSGSIAVSGWALDDIEVVSVKIYRLEGDSKVYIGDAVYVEGARPDVEQAYPGYPNNNRAGWGYLLLTNMLPNGGNGYFALQATAADLQGQETILGTKTIVCDNLSAVKPFGAIDTPGQGGTASGSDFVNFGWALPTVANFIPPDGSTIIVWVDGVPLGHPVYNRYRKDIAALFWDYNNRNGAGGYFYLDTTHYENGLHTIAWSVTDEAGNTGGIGSRYFSIQSTSPSAGRKAHSAQHTTKSVSFKTTDISKIPIDYSEPVRVKKGYNPEIEPQNLFPDEAGVVNIRIRELERVEIYFNFNRVPSPRGFSGGARGFGPLSNHGKLSNDHWTGFQVIGNQFRSLPIGSFLDSKNGVFSWTPGPGHYELYTLLFLEKFASREVCKKYIQIRIMPKYGDDLGK